MKLEISGNEGSGDVDNLTVLTIEESVNDDGLNFTIEIRDGNDEKLIELKWITIEREDLHYVKAIIEAFLNASSK